MAKNKKFIKPQRKNGKVSRASSFLGDISRCWNNKVLSAIHFSYDSPTIPNGKPNCVNYAGHLERMEGILKAKQNKPLLNNERIVTNSEFTSTASSPISIRVSIRLLNKVATSRQNKEAESHSQQSLADVSLLQTRGKQARKAATKPATKAASTNAKKSAITAPSKQSKRKSLNYQHEFVESSPNCNSATSIVLRSAGRQPRKTSIGVASKSARKTEDKTLKSITGPSKRSQIDSKNIQPKLAQSSLNESFGSSSLLGTAVRKTARKTAGQTPKSIPEPLKRSKRNSKKNQPKLPDLSYDKSPAAARKTARKTAGQAPKSILEPLRRSTRNAINNKQRKVALFKIDGSSFVLGIAGREPRKSSIGAASKTPRKTAVKTPTTSPVPTKRSKRNAINIQSKFVDSFLNESPEATLLLGTAGKQRRKTSSKAGRKAASKTAVKAPKFIPEPLKKSQAKLAESSFNESPGASSLLATVGRQPRKSSTGTASKTTRTTAFNAQRTTSVLLNRLKATDNESIASPSSLGLNTSLDRKFATPTIILRNERVSSVRLSSIKPKIRMRETPISKDNSNIQLAKESLHVSAIPQTLPCRQNEYKEIFNFIASKISDNSGGCIYLCGVPGAGKTATVAEVIKSLQRQAEQKKLPVFEFIEINGMRLTDPHQTYVDLYHHLTKKIVPWLQAHSLLEDLFSAPIEPHKTTVLLMDEFDILKNRRQDIVYNLLDWATKRTSHLIVIAIANILDPDQFLIGGIISRLGSTRIIFQPYTQHQLQEIVRARLTGIDLFENDAIQLVARKVASISGDCRRALDICRRAAEIAERECTEPKAIVSMSHVLNAFDEMITSPKVIGVRGCSKHEKLFLQAVQAEVARTGVDETVLSKVYLQFETICALNGVKVPEPGIALKISSRLGSSGLLICEHSSASIHQKIMLNVTQEEIRRAMESKN